MPEEKSAPKLINRFTGDALQKAINTTTPERKPLIENLLYEKSALMLYADDGVGKSVLTLQACMQATVAESVVFEEFHVPRACNVLYFQMERHPDESFERMRHLINVFPFDNTRFCLSAELQGIDLQSPKGKLDATNRVMECAIELPFVPDIVAFDPIYTMTAGGLETAEACNAITSFFRIVQLSLGCTILATSHTNRGVRDPEKKGRRVGQDMYGNRFLSAFFTGSYHITSKPDGVGSSWKLDKNSQKNLEKSFELIYDPSCYRSSISTNGKQNKKERLDAYLKSTKLQNLEVDFDKMQVNSGLSDSPLRGYLTGYLRDKLEICRKLSNGKLIYKYIG